MKRKIAAIFLCLLLTCDICAMGAEGTDNRNFIVNAYQGEEGALHLLCAIPEETGYAESFEVKLGEKVLPVQSVSTAGEENIPKTFYCLVDISGSMKGRMEQAKEILSTLCDGLKEDDSLVIGKMGNQITDSNLLTEKGAIQAEIEELQYTGEDTDLYGGLIHGLQFLQRDPRVNPLPVLVVISDGSDEQGDGSTWREAYEAAGSADIPIYTAAMIQSSADYEMAKELGSFARNSAGGQHFPKSEEDGAEPIPMTGEEIGLEIMEASEAVMQVMLDLSGIPANSGETYSLGVSFQSQDGKIYRDSLELTGGEIELYADSEKETEANAESDISLEESDDPFLEMHKGLTWIVGILTLAILLMAAVIITRKKKQKREEEKKKLELQEAERQRQLQQEEERKKKNCERKRLEEEYLKEQEERQRQFLRNQELQRKREKEEADRKERECYNALPRLNVRLSAIEAKGKNVNVCLAKGYELTLGRSAPAGFILDAQDRKLSGVHFVMYWDGKSVYIWDSHSTNGTSVNGVIVNQLGRVAVKPGDCIRAGSCEYRLFWEE